MKKSGVLSKYYSDYKFEDHLWYFSMPKQEDFLELAERCVKVDGEYYIKQGNIGHWVSFKQMADAIREAGNMWTGGKLRSGKEITMEMIDLFFKGEVEIYEGKNKRKGYIGSCPNIAHTMVIPMGPQYVIHDNRKYLNLWHDDMIRSNVDKLPLGKLMLELIYRSLCNGAQLHESKDVEADMLLEQVLTDNYTNPDFRFCIYWLASIVQTPGVNLQTNLWFCGEQQGVGKGTLVDVMKRIMGDSYVCTLNQTEIEAGWNDHLMGKLLVSANEFDTEGKMTGKAWNKWIKNNCNDPTINIRQRNATARSVLNVGNYIFTSNDEVPVYLDKTDRRNHLIKTTDDTYWKEYAAVVQTQYIQTDIDSVAAGFAWILEQVKVDTRFVNTSFINDLKASVISSSLNIVEEWLTHDPLITKNSKISARDCYDEFKAWMRTSNSSAPLLSETAWGRLMGKAEQFGVTRTRAAGGVKYEIGEAKVVVVEKRQEIANDVGAITKDMFTVLDNDVEVVMPVADVLTPMERMRALLKQGRGDDYDFEGADE